jgi:hypothetical protein
MNKRALLVAASLAALLLQSSSAVAGAVFFDDLTDHIPVTLSDDIWSRPGGFFVNGTFYSGLDSPHPITVAGENAIVTISGPLGWTDVQGGPGNVNIFEAGGALSDTWQMTGFTTLNFLSDTEGGPPLVPVPGNQQLVETGSLQQLANLLWTIDGGGTVSDNFYFQSDVEAPGVPESGSTLALMGLGMLGIGVFHRRIAAKRA